ncbi:MAG: HsdM family class I SAM-dependent methyltransferase [Promethearchaeia archaeon]
MAAIKNMDLDYSKLKNAKSLSSIKKWFKDYWEKLGLEYHPSSQALIGKKRSILRSIHIDFKNYKQIKKAINNSSVGNLFKKNMEVSRNGLKSPIRIIISEDSIHYFNQNAEIIKTLEITERTVRPLFASLLEHDTINAKMLSVLFGINSPIFIQAFEFLSRQIKFKQNSDNIIDTWKKMFENAYELENLNEDLFLKHFYLVALLNSILYCTYIDKKNFNANKFQDLHNYFDEFNITFLDGNLFEEIKVFSNVCEYLFDKVNKFAFEKSDIFGAIYQEMIVAGIRHQLGEYYTPPSLCKKMVNKVYKKGKKVLDTSCGSGTFLVEILKLILSQYRIGSKDSNRTKLRETISNIYGLDINPIAVFTTKVNILLLLEKYDDLLNDIDLNILRCDALEPTLTKTTRDNTIQRLLEKKVDIIITNPPWYTYKDANQEVKNKLKSISAKLDIKPNAHNVTNIEAAVVFLFRVPDLFLRKDGKGVIAFVMPRSLIVSSQNQKARRFDNFLNIEFFEFTDSVFNIDSCCVFAQFNINNQGKKSIKNKFPIPCQLLDSSTMKVKDNYLYEPYVLFQEKQNEKYMIKKLIKSEKKKHLLPCRLSDYYNEFIQGADLIPKSLLYCVETPSVEDKNFSMIQPWISPQAKGKWKKKYYMNTTVERGNLFYATLSRGLYPFHIKRYSIFLPLNQSLTFNENELGKKSKKHWKFISNVYKNERKKDLFDVGINYRNKLCKNGKVRTEQRAPYKVVFPNAKSMMAAVVEDPHGRTFIDSTLYYYGTENKKEAYYLCGMLNVRALKKSVKVIADTRHHHKRPLYFNIPHFEKTEVAIKISQISQECAKIVRNYVKKEKKLKKSEIEKLVEEKRRKIEKLGLKIYKDVQKTEIIKVYELEN